MERIAAAELRADKAEARVLALEHRVTQLCDNDLKIMHALNCTAEAVNSLTAAVVGDDDEDDHQSPPETPVRAFGKAT